MNESIISAQCLTRRFGLVVAVRDVSFDIPRAAIFGLLGPNGSGKSTIIRMLCGVLKPSDGTANVLGVDVRRDPEAIKRRIGYMSQKFSLYGDLSCTENIHFYGRVYGLSEQRLDQREAAVIELTGIGPYRDRLAAHLSGGWKQRLALACALIHEPQVLFLDEPTAGIDPVARRDLWDLLFRLASTGVTMCVTTHYMDEAERCTIVGYIHASRLIALGKPEELKASIEVTPPGTMRYEVTCASPPVAMVRAEELEFVRDVTLFGDRLHVLVENRASPEALLEAIAPNDPNASFRPVAPTLEDVFVMLSRAHSAQGVG